MDERDAIFFNCCSLFADGHPWYITRLFNLNWTLSSGVKVDFALIMIVICIILVGEVVIVFEIGVCIVIYVDFCARPEGGAGGWVSARAPAAGLVLIPVSIAPDYILWYIHAVGTWGQITVYGRINNFTSNCAGELLGLILGRHKTVLWVLEIFN